MNPVEKFQELLRELFQFEASDLDFGIYRILNYRRDQINKFIDEDLVKKVETAFKKHKDERLLSIEEKFKEAKEKVIDNFGKQAFTATGEIKAEFKETPLGKEFFEVKAQKDEVDKIDEIKEQVFTDLYNFFSRYYEEGDFVPQHRYSIKGHKYAIPYNGQEVILYWANSGQYYTKTGVLFRDYTFYADDNKKHKVIFRTVKAKEELGSNKSTKSRFFIPDDETPVELNTSDDGNKTLIIRFQYRELTEEEVTAYDVAGGSNTGKQDKINIKSCQKFSESIKDNILKALLEKTYKNDKSLLLYQITRFTAKNSKDYFIHQDLERFLQGQLEYFIKDEVLSIDTLEQERFLDKHITRAKVVREIGEELIAFLAQLENFQKRLWEKKKFVLDTEYVITMDRIPDITDFIDDILKNEEQVKEWKELGMVSGELSKKDISSPNHKFLPIDTKYFPQEFKERLLEKITEKANLDELLDGLLIKSENWQALNLLLNKYKEQVQTIYIDPPFNTGKDFLYKDRFRNSTWLQLIKERIDFIKSFLEKEGVFYLHLDENANYYGRTLLQNLNFDNIQEIIFNTNATKDEEADLFGYKSFGNRFVLKHNTVFYCFNAGCFFTKLWKPNRNTSLLKIGWLDLISKPKVASPKRIEDFAFFIEKYDNERNLQYVEIDVNEKIFPLGDLWTDIYSFTQSEKRTSDNVSFLTQKPENLIRRILQTSTKPTDLILDFFVGSGTTLSTAQKLKRKWIGIEMGTTFSEFYYDESDKKIKLGILGRLKWVLNGDKEFIAVDKKRCSHLSVDINWQGGGFFKYQVLEQYEDSLDNIEFKSNTAAEALFKEEYLIKYFLDYESRDSEYLLNTEKLQTPFSYKLKVNREEVGEPEEVTVDIPETFNYLLGLKVNKMKTRNNGGRYLFVLGEKDGKDIAIVWREYTDSWTEEDFKKDKDFITKEISQWNPNIVYINGQSVITPKLGTTRDIAEIRYIEPEFKRLLEK